MQRNLLKVIDLRGKSKQVCWYFDIVSDITHPAHSWDFVF